MNGLLSDIRYSLRQITVAPGIHVSAIAIIAVAIALTVTVYSVVRTAVLERLPYPAAERVYAVWERSAQLTAGSASSPTRVAPPVYLAWKQRTDVFEELAAYTESAAVVLGAGEPMRANALAVSANLFALLGEQPALGRGIAPDEDRVGGASVVVVSNALWQSRFGGARDVVGKSLQLDGKPHQIVGVTSPGIEVPGAMPDLFVPLMPTLEGMETITGAKFLFTLGRLQPELSTTAALARLDAVSAAVPDNDTWRAELVSVRDQIAGEMKHGLILLLGAVVIVLLIACANAANLLLARAPDRARELAIRTALGATRSRLIRLVMVDALVIATIAGVLGVISAAWAKDVVLAFSPETLPRRSAVGIDRAVLSFAGVIVALAVCAVGLIPAALSARPNLAESMKHASRTSSGSRSRTSWRKSLIIAEIALTAVLLAAAGLLIRSFSRIIETNPGFVTEQVVTFDLNLAPNKYPAPAQWRSFTEELLARTSAIDGVVASAITNNLPISGRSMIAPLTIENRELPQGPAAPQAHAASVSTGFISAMQIPLRRGRWFDDRDAANAQAVAVISESLARTLFPNEDPIGKRARTLFGQPIMKEIVGVVGDIHQTALATEPPLVFYTPVAQDPKSSFTLTIRSTRPTSAVMNDVRSVLRQIDPDQPLTRSATMQQLIARSVATPRFFVILLSTFALTSFALALAGIYAVMSASVAERRREIGMRVALGARSGDVIRLISTDVLQLALAGLLLGIGASITSSRLLESMLHQVSPTDPLNLVTVAILVISAAVIGTAVPLHRALRVQPAESIRN